MVFYFDEQLPKVIAQSLDVIEQHLNKHRVLSTEEEFGKGIKDEDLFRSLKEKNGILITNDLKMMTRRNEFALIKELGISVFLISLPSGANFDLICLTIQNMWPEIKKIAEKNNYKPFVCRLKMRGKPEFL